MMFLFLLFTVVIILLPRAMKDVIVHRGKFDLRPAFDRRLHSVGPLRGGHSQRPFPLLRGQFFLNNMCSTFTSAKVVHRGVLKSMKYIEKIRPYTVIL